MPKTDPRTTAAIVPAKMPAAGPSPIILTTYPVVYAAVPKNAAWPNESSPVYPSRRLKAQAKRAKHRACIRKIGYTTKGAIRPIASSDEYPIKRAFNPASPLFAEEPSRPHQQNNGHNQEHDGIGSLRIENFGQP